MAPEVRGRAPDAEGFGIQHRQITDGQVRLPLLRCTFLSYMSCRIAEASESPRVSIAQSSVRVCDTFPLVRSHDCWSSGTSGVPVLKDSAFDVRSIGLFESYYS